jgi:hypothetical protein
MAARATSAFFFCPVWEQAVAPPVEISQQNDTALPCGRARVPDAGGQEGFMSNITERAREFVEAKKQSGADRIGGVAAAVRRAAGDLESGLPRTSGYVRQAADTMDRASSAIRERSLDELVGSVGRFARSQPAAFFGAAVVTGFALSRFLKSAAER